MRGASIQIGASALLAGALGFWSSAATFVFLALVGVILLAHGIYDDFIKPQFRVDRRLTAWLRRRGWQVSPQRAPAFSFVLHITSPASEKEIVVTRNKGAADAVLAFTARVGLDPRWLPSLASMTGKQRSTLIQEITVFLASKDVGLTLNDPSEPTSPISWPPDVKIQTALPQDHTLSQHSVDMTAKKLELSIIGVRALIRRAAVQ